MKELPIINQLKRQDVFQCRHESHKNFGYSVSVYHILKIKKCFPEGCIYFKWKCRLLSNGHACFKGYQHVGRNCFSCPQFYEEKVQYKAVSLLSPEEYQKFSEELKEFEIWWESLVGKEIRFYGKLDSVKPQFLQFVSPQSRSLQHHGYTLIARSGFIDRFEIDDTIYFSISKKTYHSASSIKNLKLKLNPAHRDHLAFRRGDLFECTATFQLDAGRIVLSQLRHFDFEERGEGKVYSEGDTKVIQATGTFFNKQPEKCLKCPQGSLIDTVAKTNSHEKTYRQLMCFEGFPQPELCTYKPMETVVCEHCEWDEFNTVISNQ